MLNGRLRLQCLPDAGGVGGRGGEAVGAYFRMKNIGPDDPSLLELGISDIGYQSFSINPLIEVE